MTESVGLLVRDVVMADVADLCLFWSRHKSELYPHLLLPESEAAWIQCLSDPTTRWYVAVIDIDVVAVGVLSRISGWPWCSGEVGVGVDPSLRGKGIGRATLRQIFDAGFSHGLFRIEALVDPDNVASMRMVAAADMVNEGISRSALDSAGVRIDVARWAVVAGSQL